MLDHWTCLACNEINWFLYSPNLQWQPNQYVEEILKIVQMRVAYSAFVLLLTSLSKNTRLEMFSLANKSTSLSSQAITSYYCFYECIQPPLKNSSKILLYSVVLLILGQSCNFQFKFLTTLRATFSPLIHKVLITYASSVPKFHF